MNDFDNVVERRGTGSTKWSKFPPDVLPFWVADMDFAAPPHIRAALQARLDHGVFGYSETPPELVDAAVAYLAAEFDWAVSPDWLVWLPGVVTGLNLACRAIGAPGDSVMMNTPIYYPFLAVPSNAGRTGIEVPLVLQKRWTFDIDAMSAALGTHTRLFMFCNPQNPTGRIYDRDELVALAKFCERHDLLICSDEIHCDLRLDPDRRHIPIATLSDDVASRTITLMAPTKTYNTPGLCCAFAVIPDAALRRRFCDARAGLVPSIGPLAYTAALAAYEDPSDWLPRLITYLVRNRDALEACVAALPGVSMTHVEGTYLGWIDVRGLALAHPLQHFERHGLGLSDGAQFHGPGYVRFNFGCPRATLDEGLRRFTNAVRAAQSVR